MRDAPSVSWEPILAEFAGWMAVRAYSPRSVEHRLRCVRYFLRWAGDRARAPRLGVRLLRGWTLALAEHRTPRGEPLALATRACRIYALRTFVRWLRATRRIPADLREFLVPPRLPRALPSAVMNAREVERVLRGVRPAGPLGLRDRAMLELLYCTGMRRAELAALRIGDVDRERGVVVIVRGKGGRGRVVPLGRPAGRWVGRYLRRGRPGLVATTRETDALFLSRRGGPLALNRVGDLVRAHVRSASGGRRGSCHMFRHTAASVMLERGADIRFIQELLGHERLTSTQVYTRVSIAALKAVHARTHPAG